MRLFIAINLSSDTRSRLLDLRDELRSNSENGNFSKPKNLHLTLVFLGELEKKQVSQIKKIMGSLSSEKFDLIFDRVGYFRRDSGDIWWVGIRKNEELLKLQHSLKEKLVTAGFELEKRKYNPHITLGRKIITDVTPWEIERFGEKVTEVSLMKSERIEGKLTYTAIYTKHF